MNETAALLRQAAALMEATARQIDVIQAHEGRITDLETEQPALRQLLQEALTRMHALEDQLAKLAEATVHGLVDRERTA